MPLKQKRLATFTDNCDECIQRVGNGDSLLKDERAKLGMERGGCPDVEKNKDCEGSVKRCRTQILNVLKNKQKDKN